MYEALEYTLEGNLVEAARLVRRAEALWRGDGLWDWSYTIFDHMFSNQKLALLIFTARAIGLSLAHEDEMEAHLWSMQNKDGGIASLSYPSGMKAGSANVETTALALLIYDSGLLSLFPKLQPTRIAETIVVVPVLALAVLVAFLLIDGRAQKRKSIFGV